MAGLLDYLMARGAASAPDGEMPSGLPVAGGRGSPLLDAFIALQAGRVKDAMTAPRDAYMGDLQVFDPMTGHVSNEAMERANGMAGLAMTGSLSMSRPSGSLGTFAGRLSKTADQEALARAEAMLANGADRQAVWDQTGWFRGADGQMRYEIPDAGSFIKGAGSASEVAAARGGTVGGATHHPGLKQAYPQIADAQFYGYDGVGARGQFSPGDGIGIDGGMTVGLNNQLTGDARRSTLLHETQHGIQELEGFSSGSSPQITSEIIEKAKLARDALSFRQEMDALPKDADSLAKVNAVIQQYREMGMMDILPSAKARDMAMNLSADRLNKLAEPAMKQVNPSPLDYYRRSAGEVEARNVQARRNMTPEQLRARPPWLTQDVSDADQIVNLGMRLSR